MRRIWFATAAFALFILTPALALRSETVVLSLIHWAMDTFTELRLKLVSPSINLYRGTVSADEIHLIPVNNQGPAFLSIVNFAGKTHLREIVSGDLVDTVVRADQVLFYVSESDEAQDPTPVQWLDFIYWVPSELFISQTHIIRAADTTLVVPLKGLRGNRLDSGRYHATASSRYHDEIVDISLDSLMSTRGDQVSALDINCELLAPEIDSAITLQGEVTATREQLSYDFSARGNYSDISHFLSGFNTSGDLQGKLTLNARMRGNAAGFVLSDIALVLDNMPSYGFEAAGEMAFARKGDTSIRLVASGELDSMSYLVDWIDLDLTELGRAEAGLRLSGSLDKPVIDKFIVSTRSSKDLSLNVSGRLDLSARGTSAPLRNEIWVDAYAPSLTVLDRWLGSPPVDPGAWRASWRTYGTIEDINIDHLIVETGSRDTYKLRVEGSVGQVANLKDGGLSAIKAIQLDATAYTRDSATLSGLLGREIPPFQEVSANMRLAGTGDSIRAHAGEIVVQSSDLVAKLSSISAVLRPGEAQWLEDLSARLDFAISDTSALSQYSAREIPVLGPLEFTGDLSQRNKLFQLHNLEATINSEDFTLETGGSIANLESLSGVSLHNHVSGVDIQHALLALMEEFQYPGPLGKLEGSFHLENTNSKWNVSSLQIRTSDSDGPVVLSASGDIQDLVGFTTADIDARFKMRDPNLWESLTGLRISPSEGSLSVQSTPDTITLSSRARVGNTLLNGDASIAHGKETIRGIRASLDTPHLYLDDLGLQSNKVGGTDYLPVAQLEKATPVGRLTKLLSSSPDYPVDLSIKLDGITGQNTNIDSLDIHLTTEDQRYTLRRFSMAYQGALAELAGSIDLNPTPPELALGGQVIALPMATLTRDLGVDMDIEGTLTANGGIIASGKTGDELLETLNGTLALALENTIIQGAAYDVLATDLLGWISSGAILETSTHVDCAMAKFQFVNGVARTENLYVETRRMVATGNARFDLVKWDMDLTIIPRSRSRSIQIPSRIRLSGDMSSPRPTISPISAAADASAQALMLIPKFTLNLFGRGSDISGRGIQPCQADLGN